MSASSNYLENKLLDHALGEGNRNFTSPSTLYVALFTGTAAATKSNLEAGTLSDEVSNSGTAYTRQTVDFDAAASGTTQNTGTMTWTTATSNWGTVTCVAIMDSGTYGAGNVLFYGELTTSKTVNTSDTFQITTGQLSVTLA